jgi:hypothetical protein
MWDRGGGAIETKMGPAPTIVRMILIDARVYDLCAR